MLTGRFKSVFLAITFHVLILLLISQTVVIKPHHKEIEPQAIKSFIYTPPKPVLVEPEPVTNDIESEVTAEPAVVEVTEPQPIQTVTDAEQVDNTESVRREQPEAADVPPPNTEVATSKASKPPVTATFSATKQLDKLRQSLTDKMFEQDAYEYSRPKSGSVMHGKPELVPHSTQRLTEKQKKEQATQQMSPGTKTIKGDDGLCFIERDLSEVGIEGVSATEAFTCGKSKFDKSFRDHMRKVREKLGK